MAKLSIIIPVYNAEGFIENTIQTITSQNYSDYEILIVDDGSKDSSLDICKRISEKDDRVTVYSKENEGVSIARNYGVSKAKGEWITFVDADDGFTEGALDGLDDVLAKNPELVLFNYTSKKDISNKSSSSEYAIDPTLLKSCVLNFTGYADTVRSQGYPVDNFNNWTCWAKIYRKSIIQENGIIFPAGITHGEDLIFLYQYYKNISSAVYADRTAYYYRTDNVSVTRRFNAKRIVNTRALFNKLSEVLLKEDASDFGYFICNRMFACCFMYYADKANTLSAAGKKNDLKAFCEEDMVAKALSARDKKAKMSKGAKTDFFMKAVLNLLSYRKYGMAIAVSGIFNRI